MAFISSGDIQKQPRPTGPIFPGRPGSETAPTSQGQMTPGQFAMGGYAPGGAQGDSPSTSPVGYQPKAQGPNVPPGFFPGGGAWPTAPGGPYTGPRDPMQAIPGVGGGEVGGGMFPVDPAGALERARPGGLASLSPMSGFGQGQQRGATARMGSSAQRQAQDATGRARQATQRNAVGGIFDQMRSAGLSQAPAAPPAPAPGLFSDPRPPSGGLASLAPSGPRGLTPEMRAVSQRRGLGI